MSDHVFDLGPVISHGLWVVRWIDEIPKESATGDDPQIRFWFSRIFNPAWREVPFGIAIQGPPLGRSKSRQPTVVNILSTSLHVGALTELRLGMVVKDGKPIGRLRADERTYSFALPAALPGLRRGLFPANTPARDVLGIDTDAHLIPASGYRFEARKDTFVTVLHDPKRPGRPLIVPSAEVIRAFLAPVSQVARDIVRRQPPDQLQEIVRPTSGVTPDRHWRLDLVDTIPDRHVPLIANLCPQFSPVGAMAAAEAFYAKQHDLIVRQERTARLAGVVPFTDCTLGFTARIIPLSHYHDLCIEIRQVTWPYPDRPLIEIVRWKPEPEPGYDPDRVPGERFQTRPDRDVEIDPNNDPDHRSDVTAFAVDGVAWKALPKPKPVEIAFRPDADRIVIDGDIYREPEASLGASTGRTRLPAGSFVQSPGEADVEPPGVPRFELVIAMLAALKAEGLIEDFRLVTAPKGVPVTRRGERAVWSLGLKRPGHRRSLFVCEIELPSGRKILWLEIEPGARDHVSSALLLTPERPLTDAEYLALHEAIGKRKRFAEILAGTGLPRGSKAVRWYHRVSGKPLDGERALKELVALDAKV